jgi:hypothetical protein
MVRVLNSERRPLSVTLLAPTYLGSYAAKLLSHVATQLSSLDEMKPFPCRFVYVTMLHPLTKNAS